MNRALLCSAALLAWGAAAPLAAQGQSTWYDAYEAGLALQAKGQHGAAIAAFQRATALKPQPGSRVLTYGLNFVETYHPWLRLAQSALATNQLDLAEDALKKSAQFSKEPAAEREKLQQRLAAAREAAKPAPPPAAASQPQPQPVQAPPLQIPPKEEASPAVKVPPPSQEPAPTTTKPQSGAQPAPTKGLEPQKGAASHEAKVPAQSPAQTPSVQPVPIQAAPANPAPPTETPTRRGLWIALSGLVAAIAAGVTWALRRRKPASRLDHTVALPRTLSGLDATTRLGAEVTQQGRMQVGGYTLQRVLGKGACGTTYLGVRDENGMEVAIKVPHPHMLEDAEFMARFRQEAALGARLTHPKIVRILDPGPMDGTPWLAMELVQGHTLDAVVKAEAPFDLATVLDLAIDITEAIAYAHSKGVVHRDLKPANVMVGEKGAQVLDFGIARLTEGVGMTATQVFIGTPLYASPESVSHSKVGPAADRYALGCMLFEFLTGRPPFEGANTFTTLQMHLSAPLPNLDMRRPGLPPRLVRLVERLTDKRPEQRPEDGEVLTILRELREQLRA